MQEELRSEYDVVVVGGGAAGLSAGLMLARARVPALVIDGGQPRNAPAKGVHALLGHEGLSPLELIERGRGEVRAFGGQIVTGEVSEVTREGDRFLVRLSDGTSTHARRLLIATGLVDELPDIEGLRDRWGHDVIHCPWCHGWEVRDQAIGIIGCGPMSLHQALLFRQWSDDVIYVTHAAPPTDVQAEQMLARGIRIVEGTVRSVESSGEHLSGVVLEDGTLVERQALVVAPRFVARANVFRQLGLEVVEHASGAGEHVPAEPSGRTAVPGVWVAGNVTDPMAQVGAAAASGAMVAAQIAAELLEEMNRAAVEAYRAERKAPENSRP